MRNLPSVNLIRSGLRLLSLAQGKAAEIAERDDDRAMGDKKVLHGAILSPRAIEKAARRELLRRTAGLWMKRRGR